MRCPSCEADPVPTKIEDGDVVIAWHFLIHHGATYRIICGAVGRIIQPPFA